MVLKCKFCDRRFSDVDHYVAHLEKSHLDEIPKDMTSYQFYYYLKTGKTHGDCIICRKPTPWNPKTNKYARFCRNPKCKEAYVKTFQNRMIGKYGKVTLLNDPEHQRVMLANRKISGVYEWSDHVHKFHYTGSYEKSFLEFLDLIVDFDPEDIMAPSPHTYTYQYEGKEHFYIPDVFIPSLSLEIEIKDGGDNPNMHHKIQEVDKVKEHLKDQVMMSNGSQFNYLKIVNKDNRRFFQYLVKVKENFANGIMKPVFMI